MKRLTTLIVVSMLAGCGQSDESCKQLFGSTWITIESTGPSYVAVWEIGAGELDRQVTAQVQLHPYGERCDLSVIFYTDGQAVIITSQPGEGRCADLAGQWFGWRLDCETLTFETAGGSTVHT